MIGLIALIAYIAGAPVGAVIGYRWVLRQIPDAHELVLGTVLIVTIVAWPIFLAAAIGDRR